MRLMTQKVRSLKLKSSGPRLNLPYCMPISNTCGAPPGSWTTTAATQSSPPPSRMIVCTTSVQTTASMPPKTV